MNKTIILLIALITISLILFGCMEYDGDIPGFEREDEGTFTIKIDETLPETIDEQTLNTLNNEIDTTNRRLATNEELNITRRIASAPSEINDGHTTTFSITFENTTNTTLENIEIIEFIPKEIIANASMITSNQPFTIIEEDPIIMFTISNLTTNTTTKINYTFNRTKNQGPLTQQQISTIKPPTIILPAPNGTNLSTTTNSRDYDDQAEPYINIIDTSDQYCTQNSDCGDTCVFECNEHYEMCVHTGNKWFFENRASFNSRSPNAALITKCCSELFGCEFGLGRPAECCEDNENPIYGINEYAQGADEETSICCAQQADVVIIHDLPSECCEAPKAVLQHKYSTYTTGACCDSSDDELVINAGLATGECCSEEKVIVWGRGSYANHISGSNLCCGDTDNEEENLKAQYDAITNTIGEPIGCCPTDTKDYGCGTGQHRNRCICCNEGLEVKRYTYEESRIDYGKPYCAATGSGSGSGASLGAIQQQVNPQNILDTYGLFAEQ